MFLPLFATATTAVFMGGPSRRPMAAASLATETHEEERHSLALAAIRQRLAFAGRLKMKVAMTREGNQRMDMSISLACADFQGGFLENAAALARRRFFPAQLAWYAVSLVSHAG